MRLQHEWKKEEINKDVANGQHIRMDYRTKYSLIAN